MKLSILNSLMPEIVITSSVLIAAVVALRVALGGRIGRRARYALWALVLIRLLVPMPLFYSGASVLNIVNKPAIEAVAPHAIPIFPIESATGPYYADELKPNGEIVPYTGPREPVSTTISWQHFSVDEILTAVWLCGMFAVALWVLVANSRLHARLKRERRVFDVECRLPVFIADSLASPCLFGLFKPSIYLTPKSTNSQQSVEHVLLHELTHFRHLDHIWVLLRTLCLAVYWFNPLVWVAAWLSRADCELACDEAVVNRLGEQHRVEYGRTLVDMIARHGDASSFVHAATSMSSGMRGIKKRISMIVAHRKAYVPALVAVVLISAVAVACTFSGAMPEKPLPDALDKPTPDIAASPSPNSFAANNSDFDAAFEYSWDSADPVPPSDGKVVVLAHKVDGDMLSFSLNDGQAFPYWSVYWATSFNNPVYDSITDLINAIEQCENVEEINIRTTDEFTNEQIENITGQVREHFSDLVSHSYFIDIDTASDKVREVYGDTPIGFMGERILKSAEANFYVYSFEVHTDAGDEIVAANMQDGALYFYRDGEWSSPYADKRQEEIDALLSALTEPITPVTVAQGITVNAQNEFYALWEFYYLYSELLRSLPSDSQLRMSDVALVDYDYLGYDLQDGVKYHHYRPQIACMTTNPDDVHQFEVGPNGVAHHIAGYEGYLVLAADLVLAEYSENNYTCVGYSGTVSDDLSNPYTGSFDKVVLPDGTLLLNDGTVWTWGDNAFDELTQDGTSGVAVHSDGTVWRWDNDGVVWSIQESEIDNDFVDRMLVNLNENSIYWVAMNTSNDAVPPADGVPEGATYEDTARTAVDAYLNSYVNLQPGNLVRIIDYTIDDISIQMVSKKDYPNSIIFDVTYSVKLPYDIEKCTIWWAGNTVVHPERGAQWGQLGCQMIVTQSDDGLYYTTAMNIGSVGESMLDEGYEYYNAQQLWSGISTELYKKYGVTRTADVPLDRCILLEDSVQTLTADTSGVYKYSYTFSDKSGRVGGVLKSEFANTSTEEAPARRTTGISRCMYTS